MNQRRHLAVVAACATLMGAAPMVLVFHEWTWAIDSSIAIVGVFLAAMGARALRAPLVLQAVGGLVGLLVVLTLLHGHGTAFLGLIPTVGTFSRFNALLSDAGTDIHNLGMPVFDTPGLLFLVTLGIGLCAVFNDIVVIGMRRPALAGLPMLAIYAVPVAIDGSSVSFLPFVVSAAGYLWLLVTDNLDRVRLFGRRFTGDGRGVDVWEPSPLAAVGRRIAGIGVVLAVIIPFAVPGFTSGLVGVFSSGGDGDSGNGGGNGGAGSGSVDLLLDLAKSLNQGQVQVLADVTNSDPNPGYLRLATSTVITKSGVVSVAPRGLSVAQGGMPDPHVDPETGGPLHATLTKQHAVITLHNQHQNLLPVFLYPQGGTLDGISEDWHYDASQNEVFSPTATSRDGQTYSFDYLRPSYTADDLRTAPQLASNDPLQVTMTQLPQRVQQVNEIINDPRYAAGNEYDRVLKLYSYFSSANGFQYDLTIKPGTTGTDIGNFLVNKHGYCVQYAAALTWLVRAAGYPARVAIGFNQGTNVAGEGGQHLGERVDRNVWEFTNRDLHAWTEVYFVGYGWVPFDATPAAGGGTIYSPWAPDPNATPTPSPGQSGPVPSTGPGGSGSGKTKPAPEPTGAAGPIGGGGGGNDVGWWVLGSFVVLALLAVTPLMARLATRRRRSMIATSRPAVEGEPYLIADDGTAINAARMSTHAVWEEFMDTLVDYQVPVDPAESPYATTNRVATTLYLSSDVSAQVRMLGSVEQRARYARRPPEPRDLSGVIKAARKAMAARVSRGTKVRALLLPPSVMGRWQVRIGAWVVAFTARAQVIRENVNRVIGAPRRLLAGRGSR